MTALVRMRISAFTRSGRALAPLLAGLVVIGVLYGGGRAQAGAAYGFSALMLFPVIAWQAKLLLDAEPDVQRQLARVAVGARREVSAGVLAATVLGLLTCVIAMISPWIFGGIKGPDPGTDQPSLASGITLGALAHLLAVPAAVALGALASRAVTRSVLTGVTVLVTGSIMAIVFGLQESVAPWLVPPVMAVARTLSQAHGLAPASTFVLLAVRAVLWSAVTFAGYARLRRTRA
jgi:hypothetical protein